MVSPHQTFLIERRSKRTLAERHAFPSPRMENRDAKPWLASTRKWQFTWPEQRLLDIRPVIEPPETAHHAEHHKSGIRWFDVVMALGVLCLSAGSLYVAFHTGHTMEKLVAQNERLVQAQSMPMLQYQHGNLNDAGERSLDFTITNVGSGTARVVWVKLKSDGREFTDWQTFTRSLDTGGGDQIDLVTSFIAQTTLSAGEERRVFSWAYPEGEGAQSQWRRLDSARFEATVEGCYCSVFDQCWTSNMTADIPQEVTSCEAPTPVAPSEAH
jgi:hypothetical protein